MYYLHTLLATLSKILYLVNISTSTNHEITSPKQLFFLAHSTLQKKSVYKAYKHLRIKNLYLLCNTI